MASALGGAAGGH